MPTALATLRRVAWLVLGSLALLADPALHAAGTFNVNTTTDSHMVKSDGTDSTGHISLRSAVEAANAASGTSVINVPAGTYNLSLGELDLAPSGHQTNTIAGAGAGLTLVTQTDPTNRVFNIDTNSVGATVTTFSSLTIQGGHDGMDHLGGAGILAGSIIALPADVLALSNCVIQNNHCTTNSTREPGGGLQMAAGNLYLTSCTFTNNSSGQSFGGAIFLLAQTVVSSLNATNCLFVSNSLTNNSVAGPDGGGAIMIETPSGSVHNLSACSFANNDAIGNLGDGFGGAMQINGGILNVSYSTFVNNFATGPLGLGGAIYADAGTLNLSFSRLTDNTASSIGSGLYNHGNNAANTSAMNDWWGCNGGPGAGGCDSAYSNLGGTLVDNPWLIITNTASPNPINVGQSTTLTASVLQNSAGQSLTPVQVTVLLGLPLTWNGAVDGGLTSTQSVIQASGLATATFTNDNTCGPAGANATLDNGVATATLEVLCPDLTLTKTNNVGTSVPLGGNWNWILHVANAGPAPAAFANGNTIALDNLPNSGIIYGPPAILNATGLSGSLKAGIDSSSNLTVTASGAVTLSPGGSFDVQLLANPQAEGEFVNPRYGGVCLANPNNSVPETNTDNNSAFNTVEVTCPVITGTLSGNSTICSAGTAVVTVTLSGGTPPYAVTLSNGGGTLTGPSPLVFSVSPSATTTYSFLYGTDSQGCSVNGSGSATVTVVSLASLAITPNPTAVLANSAGNSASVPAGLGNYAWTITNGLITGPTNLSTVTYVAGTSNNVTLGVAVSNPAGCDGAATAAVPITLGFSVHTNVTFTDALTASTMPMAFDGTNYWSGSGGSTSGTRLASYSLSGQLVATYSPGLDFRSLTTEPNGTVLARAYDSGVIYVMTSPGVFTSSGVTLTGGSLDPQSSVVLNGTANEFDAVSGGVVSRWSTNGTYLGAVNLIGFGAVPGEQASPQSRGLAALGNLWLTYNGAGVLSLWDVSGNRVTELALPGAGSSNDSDWSFSFCNGKVFIVDVAGSTWRGFDLFGGATVAVLAAEANTNWTADVISKISGVGSLPGVNLIPVISPSPIPNLAQLRACQAVLVFSDNPFTDPVAMGNVLADYIDQGGGVVLQTFAFYDAGGYGIQGRVSTNGYLPFILGTNSYPANLTLVPELPQSPLLANVGSFNGGATSYQNSPLSLTTGATLAAEWSNGRPLVGSIDDRPGRCAGLNFFPPSSDVNSVGWVSSTDGAKLMADALLWSGRIPPTILNAPVDQVQPPGATTTFKVLAGGTPPLTYQWRLNGNTLASATNNTLAVSVLPANEGAYSVVVSNLFGATTTLNAALNPQLRLLPSAVVNGTFSIYLADADGTAVATNRASRVSLYSTTNLALPASAWTLLPNPVVPSGTQLRADGFSVTNGFSQFFKAVEIP